LKDVSYSYLYFGKTKSEEWKETKRAEGSTSGMVSLD